VRRGSIVQLVLLAVLAAAIAWGVAWWIPWLPTSAGEEADRIGFVFLFTTVICVGVFAVVAAVLAYCVLKFRARPDELRDGPPTHGHTGLEIVWTAVPAVLVTAISIVSAIVLAQNSFAGDDAMRVKVTGQQFAWQFTYPNGQTYGILRLPKDRTTELAITAKDVLHSFWVPQLYQKQDAVVGQTNTIPVTPHRTGTFPVICTELCGLGHAIMRSRVEIMEQADFDRWMREGGRATEEEAPGLAVFNQKGCGSCHTFSAANSAAQIGPSLDELKEAAARAKQPLEPFVRRSILEPDAYVEPGYQAGVMPAYEGQITPDELDALVQYLSENAKG